MIPRKEVSLELLVVKSLLGVSVTMLQHLTTQTEPQAFPGQWVTILRYLALQKAPTF